MKQSILALAITMLASGGAAALDLTEDGSL